MDQSFKVVKKLVQDFQAQESYYLSPDYQESEARTDFIDKFFMALGWDVRHERQKNPYEQEVKIEKEVKTALAQRRADYAFFVAPNYRDPRFYVEAKKPSKNLKNAPDYHQTTRYGWNKGTPIAVLTDFEEFHILDCRYKPDLGTALQRALKTYHYTDYTNEEKFKEIYYLFSREAVAEGSLEKFAATLPKPKGKARQRALFKGGYQPVDEAFLAELDGYRETLAKAFKKSNPELESDELTEIVQRTIDRLVFIRFLEDKQIEDAQMLSYRSKPSAWAAFLAECRRLEPKYNGLVFRTHPILDKPDFAPPDDTDFADICDELADETSPYNFELIPIEILGSIYERFLGKVVNATEKRVKVEEKPEVRKAGGVYYTPQYIVRYIVENTVGKLLYEEETTPPPLRGVPSPSTGEGQGEGEAKSSLPLVPSRKGRGDSGAREGSPLPPTGEGVTKKFKLTPDQVAKLSFADIACGSGSFLIEVYNELIRFHELYYTTNPTKAKKGDTETRDGKIILSLKKRQEILTNNIYGVDIDYQATEVTQLSLYLKLLEDVTLSQTHMFKDKILPELKNNIVCGNSLIGRDILEGDLFGTCEESPLHARIPSPLAGESQGEGLSKKLKPMDFANAFPDVMKRGGFDAVVGNPPYVTLTLGKKQKSEEDFILEYYKQHYQEATEYKINIFAVFLSKAIRLAKKGGYISYITPNTLYTNIYFKELRKSILDACDILNLSDFRYKVFEDAEIGGNAVFVLNKGKTGKTKTKLVEVDSMKSFNEAVEIVEVDQETFYKIPEFRFLFDFAIAGILLKLREDTVELEKLAIFYQGVITGDNKKFLGTKKLNEKWKKILRGKDIDRYNLEWANQYVLFDKKVLWSNTDENMFYAEEKLISRQTSDHLAAVYDNKKYISLDSTHVIIPKGINPKYLLAIYNSKLLNFYYQKNTAEVGKTFAQVKIANLKNLPIRTIDFTNPQDKSRHDQMVKLVDDMLKAKRELAGASMEQDIQRLERHCSALDRQIDTLVYDLYGLTEEEIQIVEGK